jgi:hypothetical protein
VTNECEYNTTIALLEQKNQQLALMFEKERENSLEGGEALKKYKD